MEVCTLSREVMFQPLSAPLQRGIRFFHIPLPASPSAHLAMGFPAEAGGIQAYPVPHN